MKLLYTKYGQGKDILIYFLSDVQYDKNEIISNNDKKIKKKYRHVVMNQLYCYSIWNEKTHAHNNYVRTCIGPWIVSQHHYGKYPISFLPYFHKYLICFS